MKTCNAKRVETFTTQDQAPANGVPDLLKNRSADAGKGTDMVTIFLTAEQVADRVQLNPQIVRRMAVEGRFPGAVRLAGKTWRFRQDVLDSLGKGEKP